MEDLDNLSFGELRVTASLATLVRSVRQLVRLIPGIRVVPQVLGAVIGLDSVGMAGD